MLIRLLRCHAPLRRPPIRLLMAALLLAQAWVFGAGWMVSPVAVAADLFTELRTFQGVVLLPSPELAPFAALDPWRVEMNRPRPGSTAIVRGRYLVQYRDPQGGTGSAQIGGAVGRSEMDQTLSALATRSFTRCSADAAYCADNVAGQDDAEPASEVFRGLLVQDSEAVVEHVTCCGGHYWALTWYDASRDMTYTLVLVGPLADEYGGTITPDNETTALTMAEIAAQLAPLE